MIIQVINFVRILSNKLKYDPVILINLNCPITFQLATKLMKPIARYVHIADNFSCMQAC